jgi:hypothetical protein
LTYRHRELPELLELFERPWFDRLWIRQEIYLSHSKVVVQFGTATITWAIFCRAAIGIWKMKRNTTSSIYKPLNRRLGFRYALFFNSRAQLISLRKHFGRCLCTDPRDRVYAIMSMLPEEQRAFLPPPDYSLSVVEIWKKTTLVVQL